MKYSVYERGHMMTLVKGGAQYGQGTTSDPQIQTKHIPHLSFKFQNDQPCLTPNSDDPEDILDD